jgi:hypothetical protein
VVLHEILTGKNEFYAKDVASTAWRVLEHVPSSVEEARPDVPPGLGDVLKKALSKDPEDRHKDALEFAQDLRRVRGIPADDAAKMLADAAARDFNNPELAASFKATELVTLDKKWRETKRFSFRPSRRIRRSNSSIRVRSSNPPTLPPTRTNIDISDAMQQFAHRRGLLVGVAAVAVIAGAGTIAALRQRPADPGPASVFLVEGSVAAVGFSAQPAPPPPDPAAIVPTKAGAPVEPPPTDSSARAPGSLSTNATAKVAPPKSRSELLTRTFTRQQPQIARCFSQHASDVSGSPEISVRFEVGTDGHVISAQVQPGALGSMPLGQCIAGVARGTDFGPQPEPTTFRIPITAKRGP